MTGVLLMLALSGCSESPRSLVKSLKDPEGLSVQMAGRTIDGTVGELAKLMGEPAKARSVHEKLLHSVICDISSVKVAADWTYEAACLSPVDHSKVLTLYLPDPSCGVGGGAEEYVKKARASLEELVGKPPASGVLRLATAKRLRVIGIGYADKQKPGLAPVVYIQKP